MGKHKEKHKSKKHKKDKKKHKRERKYSSSSSSSTEEFIEKNSKTKKSRTYSSSSSSSSEWVEKQKSPSPEMHSTSIEKSSLKRDEWLSLPTSFMSTSNVDRRKQRQENKKLEKERSQYNPRDSVRELNPYWKDGGDGLPGLGQFKKPADDTTYKKSFRGGSSNWRKKSDSSNRGDHKERQEFKQEDAHRESKESVVNTGGGYTSREDTYRGTVHKDNEDSVLSPKELNALAAKLIKAEIMGNNSLAAELKEKLDRARKASEDGGAHDADAQEVILTTTDGKGYSRPVKLQSEYGEGSGTKRKKQRVETHKDGQRVRYFADDDKHSLKQMFENEKYSSVEEQNSQFLKMAGKIRNDDMDDIFTDKIREKESDERTDRRNRERAINEHKRVTESLDNCSRCLQSEAMQKHLMISMGETAYLSLPNFEPLTDGHCLLIPIRHAPCATQLDENEWSEILDLRKAICKMFASQDEDVIFFETAMSLQRFPHMQIQCIPMPKEEGELAPIYFKKAIDESETEWASNKKLVSLAGRDVRRAVPKGLPYFCISFGMTEGYAHVIEDEKYFPHNFAQEIIGGMLDLHHSKWRKPKRQSFDEQSKRVVQFTKTWTPYDCTIK